LPPAEIRGKHLRMAVSSNMLPLGTALPQFSLPDTASGRTVASSELGGKPSVVAFICNHCPYVKHIRQGLADFGRYCAERGVALVAISSNDPVTHPDDGPKEMALEARSAGYAFPYLFDETQAVARAFNAACTPEFYVFGSDGKLAYRGQFDGARPKNDVPVTGADVRAAVDALLAGKQPNADQIPSIGCSIKWKAA
jgi:peroxiredoxin